jgi:hypothetical protein
MATTKEGEMNTPTVHPKVTAAGLSGAVVTVALYVASLFGVTVPGEVGAALGTIAAFGAGYLRTP